MPNSPRLIGMKARTYMRVTCHGTAASCLLLALGTRDLPWLPYAHVWAFMYVVPAVLLTWLGFSPGNNLLGAFAGAATIVSNVARGLLVPFGKLAGWPAVSQFTWGQVLTSATVFWSLAGAFVLLFFTRVQFVGAVDRARVDVARG